MIGKLILLVVLIVSTVFTVISVKYGITNKVALFYNLIPIAFTIALGLGILLILLGV